MSDPVVELRSDTLTQPTPAMRQAMMEAEVGDDVYGEDPNVNALQEEAAELLGKEAALFVPSGTMANLISVKSHTQPGDEVIIHPMSHTVRMESGGAAVLAGVQWRMLGNPDGTLPVAEVEAAIYRGDNPHIAPTSLIAMENTHNMLGGTVLPLDALDAVSKVARAHGVPMHLDGARLLNAAVALDVKPTRITSAFDSTSLCFSKGLGAPVGSIVAGSKAFIARAHRFRKMVGGGMRQAGFLAAAARHALRHHVTRLAEDHEHARRLAEAIANERHLELIYGMPQTNIVFFRCTHPRLTMPKLAQALAERGVRIGVVGQDSARAVTHLNVDAAGIERAIAALHAVLAE
ncbi:MAG TPA: low-specificity L-threonine aldolase [bacterium]|nr:low-specificity L-threonine aldolase [bacterium]